MKREDQFSFENIDSNAKIFDFFEDRLNHGYDYYEILKTINLINDRKKIETMNDIIESMKNEHGYPPVDFCWLSMGSSGRFEQLYRTDQDNALIYDDLEQTGSTERTHRYFEIFSKSVNDKFNDLGFKLCTGNVMASNEFWRGGKSFWLKRMGEWLENPSRQNIRNLTIFLDFRWLFGKEAYAAALRKRLGELIKINPLFLSFLAQDACAGKLPFEFLERQAVRKNRDLAIEINIKTQLMVHVVDCIRVFAIKHNCADTNTIKRIEFLENNHILSSDLALNLKESLELIIGYKLKSRNDLLDVKQMSDTDIENLRQTVKNISELRSTTKEEFFPN